MITQRVRLPTDRTGGTPVSPTLGALEEFVGYHIRRAASVFGVNFTQSMEGTGLRQVLFGILCIVQANPGINQGKVGRALGIERGNMVSLIKELYDAGLIDRRADVGDRRAFVLTMTSDGNVALAEAVSRLKAHEDQLLANLDEAEQRQLIDLLLRISSRSN